MLISLGELKEFIKDLEEQGATDDTDIYFKRYYNGVEELSVSDISRYYPETSAPYIEITLK